jgi:hypothetical protein
VTLTALVLASVALATSVTAAILAGLLLFQNSQTTADLRKHLRDHPTSGGDTPDLAELREQLERLGGLFDELTAWANAVDDLIRPHDDSDDSADDDQPAATALMAAVNRPRPEPPR